MKCEIGEREEYVSGERAECERGERVGCERGERVEWREWNVRVGRE